MTDAIGFPSDKPIALSHPKSNFDKSKYICRNSTGHARKTLVYVIPSFGWYTQDGPDSNSAIPPLDLPSRLFSP